MKALRRLLSVPIEFAFPWGEVMWVFCLFTFYLLFSVDGWLSLIEPLTPDKKLPCLFVMVDGLLLSMEMPAKKLSLIDEIVCEKPPGILDELFLFITVWDIAGYCVLDFIILIGPSCKLFFLFDFEKSTLLWSRSLRVSLFSASLIYSEDEISPLFCFAFPEKLWTC